MLGMSMPIRCNINVLLARENLKRAELNEKPLTWFDVSKATKLTHSALLKLARGDSTRVDFETIDKLMDFFKTNDVDDIISRVPPTTPENS
jgi:DNA-binding Xre family transcriptional regulator